MSQLSPIVGTFSLVAWALASCSGPPHRFEVDPGDRDVGGGTLTLYDTTTPMHIVGGDLVGERPDRADGSGWILITFADGGQTRCSIGYVTNGEDEPHRFVIEDGRCIPR